MSIRIIEAGTVPYLRSQTIYHGLGYSQIPETPDTIVFVTPESPYMCIGYFQNAAGELDLNFCRANNLPIVRRETGGGAVFIDHNQLFVQWIFQRKSLPPRIDQRFQLFLKPIIETYKFFGINAYYHPINDVHVAGAKIVGSGAGTIGNAEVVTGNFIFDFNYNLMSRALYSPDHQFRNEFTRGLKKYLTTFKRELPHQPSKKEVVQAYIKNCEKLFGQKLMEDEFTKDELNMMKKLDHKFQAESWIHMNDQPKNKSRIIKIHSGVWLGQKSYTYNSGLLKVTMRLNNNRIEALSLDGDFETRLEFDLKILEQLLIDNLLDPKGLEKKIDSFFVKNNIKDQGLATKEWIESLMGIKAMQLNAGGNESMGE